MAPSSFTNWIEVEKVRDPDFAKKVFACDLEKKFEECWDVAQQSCRENEKFDFNNEEDTWREKYENLKSRIEDIVRY